VGGPAGAQRAREAAQRSLDTYAARTGNPVPAQLSASPPELDAAVNEIAQAIGSQFAGRVYAYHDPRPDALNGLAIGKAAFVNTANVEINAARTSLHEFKHTVEQIAKAETAQGLTGTAAQKFVAEIDSIYDDMTEEGKRAYLEKFLAKDELVGIKDPAAREARIQQLLAAPETRSEMTADFLGNRATDKQFWKDVAEADPEGFKGFVEKWLRIIDNLLAQLRGTKTQSRKESARVDKYVRDLNQAKMVAREALIAYSRATRQPAPGRPKMDVPAAVAQAPQAKASGVRLYEGKSGFVVDEEALQRRNLAGVKAPNPELLGQEQADMFAAAAKKEAEASFDKAGKFIGKYKYRVAIQRGRGGVYMFNDLEAAKQFADTYGQRKGAATAPQLSARQPVDSAKAENRMAIVVGAKPGEFNWNFTRSDLQPPPFSAPTQYGPRLEVIGEKVYEILRSGGFKKLAEDAFGIKGLRVAPLHGSWLNKPEPSFALYAEDLTFEQADELSKLLGFAFAQDATVVFQPTSEESPGEIPAIYIGGSKKLTDAQMKAVLSSAQAEGIDYSSTADGKAVRFLHFGDEAGLAELMEKAARIAGSAGLGAPKVVYVRSQLNEAESYTKGSGGSSGQAAWLGSGEAGRPDLFRRTVDHVLVPYAKTVGAEGYRFAVSRFGQRFGLDADQQELIRQALLPKGGATKSTVGIASGKVKLDIKPTGARGTVSVSDILWALQNQSAQAGLIEPGDYSDQARKLIAEAIADEVIYNITDTSSGKSAIGWYDRALKAAKEKYATVFPEIKTDRDRELMFDAVLGITSQGNDVFNNSLYAGRVYELVTRQNMTLGEAVAALKGSFGGETNAIENNILKLEDLLNRNGYDAMRAFFNKKDLVANINARLRSDTTLFYKNKPLEVEGAATQKVTGWMVFGPKIGSFINNLHGDYSTLTADLWFSRTWNRILGFSFVHSPALEADQYQKFVSAVLDEYRFVRDREGPIQPKKISDTGRATMPEFGKDTEELTDSDVGQIVADPDEALRYAAELEKLYRKGSYKVKSDLRRAAKNWIENREKPVALPRTDLERDFQQRTVETAQRIIKRRYGQDITIADIQAALWYYEKDNLFKLLGGTNKKSEAADYAGAADEMLKAYQAGDLFYAKTDDRYVWGNKGDYLNQRPAASARQRDIEDVPREQLAGRRISLPVLIEDTGQTATITLDAKDALDDVEEREGAMQRLLECLRK
jgi:hypothetical protein